MDIVGKEVTHVKYGIGTIVEVNENKMRVDFDADTKMFIYPESFENFFTLKDKRAKKFIDEKLNEINKVRKLEQKQKEKEELLRIFKRKLNLKDNSQAAFDVNYNDWNSFLETWSISIGVHLSGNNKGKPRLPKNLNMNSVCLFTMKPEGSTENDRIILGAFMTPDDFIGENCETGIITAHEKYRIIWKTGQEELLFWNYFSNDAKLDKWGSSKIKYVSITIVKNILEDMIKLMPEQNEKELMQNFYQYFCQMNNL